jgi:hypothetical protein
MKLLNTVSKSVALEVVSSLNGINSSINYKFVRVHSPTYSGVCILLNFGEVHGEIASMFLRELTNHICSIIEFHFSELDDRLTALLKVDGLELSPFLEYLLGVQNYVVEVEKLESYDTPVNPIDEVGSINNSKTRLRGGSMANKETLATAELGIPANMFVKEVQGKDLVENGSNKLKSEIIHILTRSKEAKKFFPDIYEFTFSEITKFTRVVMPHYFDHVDLSRLILDTSIPIDCVKQCYVEIFSSLFSGFYVEKPVRAPKDYVNRMFFDRVERRTRQVLDEFKGFSTTLNQMMENGFVLNDYQVPPLFELLDLIKTKQDVMARLAVNTVYESHHDLIASNILVNFSKADMALKNFKLIDCRGEGETGYQYRHWFYDLCKAKFFVSGYDLIRRKFTKLQMRNLNGTINVHLGFDLSNEVTQRYLELNASLFGLIESATGTVDVVLNDPNWKEKILFGEGLMFLADIPPRIVDEADEEMVLCFYCFGIQLLMQYLEQYLQIAEMSDLRKTDSNLLLDNSRSVTTSHELSVSSSTSGGRLAEALS